VLRLRGRTLAPEIVDQAVDRDRFADMKDEIGKERARLRTTELEHPAVATDLERSEETNFKRPHANSLAAATDAG
jgi:hypothetical protein